MADKTIDELTAATTMGNDDLLVLQQGGTAKKLSGKQLGDYVYNAAAEKVAEVNQAVDDARSSINDIVESVQSMTQLGTDTTLTTTGMAADAKAAGDKIKAVETAALADLAQGTTSGSIVTITDGADNIPVKKITVNIEPVQEGSGDPSPDNVRPITGWAGRNIIKVGKNLYDASKATSGKYVNSGGTLSNASNYSASDYTYIGGKPVVLSGLGGTDDTVYVAYYDSNKQFISSVHQNNNNQNLIPPTGADYIRFSVRTGETTTQCEVGSEATDYEPYQGETYNITFPSEAGTVYGGKLDVNEDGSGVLTVDRVGVDLSTLSWTTRGTGETKKVISANVPYAYVTMYAQTRGFMHEIYQEWAPSNANMLTANVDNNNVGIYSYRQNSGAEKVIYMAILRENNASGIFVYKIAKPITYSITADQITTFLGANNIWADTGDITEFVYRKAPIDSSDIDEKIAEIEPIIAGRETAMTATKNYSSGGLVIVDHTLYKLDTNVASGETFASGINCHITTVEAEIAECVPNYRSVNGKDLSSDVTLTAEDVPYDDSLSEHASGSVGEAVSWLRESLKTEIIGGDLIYNKNMVISKSTFYSLRIPRVRVGASITETFYSVSSADTYLFTIPNHSTKVTLPVIQSRIGAGVCFTDDNGIIISGYVNSTADSGTYITLDIPSTATKIGVPISRNWDNPTVTFSTQSEIIDLMDYLLIGLHVRPQNSGVLNAIKRARQLTDLKWTPLYDIARTSIVSGDSYYSDEHEYFEDEFSNGVEYTGLPYSDTATDYSRTLGITKPLDVFVTTVRNDKSVEALESAYRQLDPSYYGVACTGLTAYALDLPYVYSTRYANIPGFTPQFYISRNGNRHDLKDLKLCDVLQISGHCALVTDIIYDDDGEVLFVEISEQTRLGSTSKKVLGGPRGGICRRVTWSAEEIYDYFVNFQVYRYEYIDKVKYIPSPYSPMVDEGNRITDVDFPLLPYYGNKCVVEGQSRQIKLLASDNTYTHALVKKNGVAWNENGSTDYYTVSNGEVNIQCDSDAAVYTAKLITLNGNTIQYSTRSCEWYVISDIAVSYTVGENSVQFTVTAGSDEFYPWFANIRDAVTINGYNTMIFDEYEKATESNNTVYTFSVEYSTTPTQYLLGLKSDKYGVIYLSGQIS